MNASDFAALAATVESCPPLDVAADLSVSVDDHRVRVESYTDRVTVRAPSLSALVGIGRGIDGDHRAAPVGALRIAALLAAADLTVVFRVRGSEVARLGADTAGVAYRDVSVRPGGLIAAVL